MTTTYEAGLLRAVLLRPDDDLPRLVYADWMDEHDQPEHAEFIRVQCRIWETGRHHCYEACCPPDFEGCPNKALRERERELLELHGGELARDVAAVFGSSRYHFDYGYNGLSNVRWEFRRGFVAEVRLTLGAFLGEPCDMPWGPPGSTCHKCDGTGTVEGVARRLFQSQPVERVTFSDAEIFPSGGNLTYYVGGLGRWPRRYWSRLDGLPSRRAALDALSEVACEYGRERANLTNGGER